MAEQPSMIRVEPLDDERAVVGADRGSRVPLIALALGLAGVVALVVLGDDPRPGESDAAPTSAPSPPATDAPADDGRLDAAVVVRELPDELFAAELFVADPTADTLGALFDAAGGIEATTLATAEGAFDLVRFDPDDPDRLLSSMRRSYGEAQNQDLNEVWVRRGDRVDQRRWAPGIEHDFAHHNADGTVTMWSHGGGDGFAPRSATIYGDDFEPLSTTSTPLYASRFSSDGGVTFALTGDGDYYSDADGFRELVADDGEVRTVLADGDEHGWIDHPEPGLLVAYPADPEHTTAVWDTATLEPLPEHPLAGRHLRRAAVSGDGTRAVAAHADEHLVVIDLSSGRVLDRFGDGLDIDGVDQPIAVDHHASIAVTVERDGTVSIWWVGDDTPAVTIRGSAMQPRWLDEELAARTSSVVSLDAQRLALLLRATGTEPTRWRIVDLNPSAWIDRACALAGRSLTTAESTVTGLSGAACGLDR